MEVLKMPTAQEHSAAAPWKNVHNMLTKQGAEFGLVILSLKDGGLPLCLIRIQTMQKFSGMILALTNPTCPCHMIRCCLELSLIQLVRRG